MAARGKHPPRPALAPDQLDLARSLYLRRGATPKWVAQQFDPPLDWRTIQAAALQLGWALEREKLDDARKARRRPDAEAQIALEVEQDERHAAQARRELDLRDLLIARAFSDVQGMTAKEARAALRAVSGIKDLQFVERLARNRATERIADDAAENLRAVSEKMLAALEKKKTEGAPPAAAAPAPAAPPAGGNGKGNGNGNGGHA
jgi:hypothetical protein